MSSLSRSSSFWFHWFATLSVEGNNGFIYFGQSGVSYELVVSLFEEKSEKTEGTSPTPLVFAPDWKGAFEFSTIAEDLFFAQQAPFARPPSSSFNSCSFTCNNDEETSVMALCSMPCCDEGDIFQDAGSAIQNGTAATTAHSSRPRSDRPTTSNLGSSNHGRALPGIHRALVPGAPRTKGRKNSNRGRHHGGGGDYYHQKGYGKGQDPQVPVPPMMPMMMPYPQPLMTAPMQPPVLDKGHWQRLATPWSDGASAAAQCQQRLVWLRLQAYQLLGRQACRWCLSLWPQRVLSYRYPRKIPIKEGPSPAKTEPSLERNEERRRQFAFKFAVYGTRDGKSKTKKAICKACTLRSELWARARTTY